MVVQWVFSKGNEKGVRWVVSKVDLCGGLLVGCEVGILDGWPVGIREG